MSKARRIRFGVIGLGRQATEQLIPSLLLIPDAEVAGLCCTRLSAAKELATRLRATHATTRWQDFLETPEIDAIVVAATPSVHFEASRQALMSGKPIFVEKPPAPSSAHIASLLRTASRTRHPLIRIGLNFKYAQPFLLLHRLIQEHKGPWVVSLRLVSGPTATTRKQGRFDDLLFGLGLHAFDLARELIGSLKLRFFRCLHRNGYASCSLSVSGIGETVADLHLGDYGNHFEFRIDVVCKDGVSISLDQQNHITIRHSGFHPNGLKGAKVTYQWPHRRGGYDRTGYRPQLHSFITSIIQKTSDYGELRHCHDYYSLIDVIRKGAAKS